MAHTVALLIGTFGRDIGLLVAAYFASRSESAFRLGASGEYESCMELSASKLIFALRGACCGGHITLVLALVCDDEDWTHALCCAADAGHLDIVKIAIQYGAAGHQSALIEACNANRHDIVRYLASDILNCPCGNGMRHKKQRTDAPAS